MVSPASGRTVLTHRMAALSSFMGTARRHRYLGLMLAGWWVELLLAAAGLIPMLTTLIVVASVYAAVVLARCVGDLASTAGEVAGTGNAAAMEVSSIIGMSTPLSA